MSLWPRSLFGRNLLMMVLLCLACQVVSGALFWGMVMRQRMQLTSDAMVRTYDALEGGLRALDAPQRQRFVAQFNAQKQGGWQRRDGERLTRLERAHLRQIGVRLAARGGRLVWQTGTERSLGFEIPLDGERYWLAVPSLIPAREFPWNWIAGSSAAALLAALGAWLIQRRINRPLRELVGAARELGRGGRPPPLREDGPSEIAVVAHGFNEMVAGLSHNERERALMLAGLSHDLRTPLAKMRLATEMLDGAQDADLLASLNRNIAAMDRLLTQFLDFTRSAQGGGDALDPMRSVDLNEVVRDALDLCAAQPGEISPLDFQAGAIPALALRPESVRRLVVNLVVNAQRHGAPPIEVETGQSDGCVWLEVRDRGPGIPPGRTEALKQPFARGDDARGGPAGAGLGLAIVLRIAADHGAQLDLRTRSGGGLVAHVGWPCA